MATLSELQKRHVIHELRLPLRAEALPLRRIYFSSAFGKLVKEDLPKIPSTMFGNELPAKQQVHMLFERFIEGGSFRQPRQFRILNPSRHGVWEFKTGDVRIFGWFPEKDCFFAVIGTDTFTVKDQRLYDFHIENVLNFRRELDLDDPRFVAGTEDDNVISA